MKLFYFFIISNVCFSQTNLNEVVKFINNSNFNYEYDCDNCTLLKSSNSINLLFENIENNDENSNLFNLYQNELGQFLVIKFNNLEFKLRIISFDLYKLLIFSTGDFLVLDLNRENFLFVKCLLPTFLSGYSAFIKIESIEAIHSLDYIFKPQNSIYLNGNFSFMSSNYKYFSDFIIENIYVDKPNFSERHNILEMNLNKLFFLMESEVTFNYFREFKIKRKISDDIFWFLYPNKYLFE
jgi:hypothetical protein